jgi:hypothetical protein
MNRQRSDRLMKRLSTGELTDAERRELDELCAGDETLRTEVRRTDAILAAAHESIVEPPSDFEWAAFSTRLRATIEAEPPRPYRRFRTWLTGLGLLPAFRPRRLALAASTVATAAAAVLIAVLAFGPGTKPGTTVAGPVDLPELEWTPDEIDATYQVAEVLPDEELLTLERQLWQELDEVDRIIEEAPSLDGSETTDEDTILG